MRKLLLLILIAATISFNAQDCESVDKAFRSADIELIGPFLSETMDMDICGKGGVLSSQQAKMLLDHFFKTNSVLSFHILHSSPYDNKKQHVIAEYKTSKGNFTIIYKIENRDGALYVRHLRIDKAS